MNIGDFVAIRQYFGKAGGVMYVYRDSSRRPEYIAFAPRGTATSDSMWFIINMRYDANGDFSYWLVSDERQILDNRATTVDYADPAL